MLIELHRSTNPRKSIDVDEWLSTHPSLISSITMAILDCIIQATDLQQDRSIIDRHLN